MTARTMSPMPSVERKPAPWALQGQAWIVVLRLSATSPARSVFLPADLQSTLSAPVSVLTVVDYSSAPCGPYRELLFIPGTLRFADGRRHASISRIVVSTWESVVNGRANWGIPKDIAEFDVKAEGSRTHVVVREPGHAHTLCNIRFGPTRGPRLPLSTRWLPPPWRALAQRLDGSTFVYRPWARGTMRCCNVEDVSIDATSFPDIATERVLATLHVDRFDMTFPVARVLGS